MDESNLTIEEYIELLEKRARRCGETIGWRTATYVTMDCEDLDSFAGSEGDFSAIVYDDAPTSSYNVSSEPADLFWNTYDTCGGVQKEEAVILVEFVGALTFRSKARNLELKRRNIKNLYLTANTPYPSRKIRYISAWISPNHHEESMINTPYPEDFIRRIQDTVQEYSGRFRRYQTWPLLQVTPNTPYWRSPIRRIDPIPAAI
nr:hypothetical protein [Tanacetum cinerariifolium]